VTRPAVSDAWWHGRFDPGRRGLAILAVLALLGALGGAWYFIAAGAAGAATGTGGRPTASPDASPDTGTATGALAAVPAALASGWPTAPDTVTPSPSPAPIVVDVVGKVSSPGVVELPAGARIHDAITAAGGILPGTDLTTLDLARRLRDGQEVFVGIPLPSGAAAQAGGGVVGGEPAQVDAGSGSASPDVVNLNTATSQQLQALPGVGPVLAQHILDWRSQHGRFTSVAQLQQVSGVGPAKYAALVARVSV
jgi:competence protein ComEA